MTDNVDVKVMSRCIAANAPLTHDLIEVLDAEIDPPGGPRRRRPRLIMPTSVATDTEPVKSCSARVSKRRSRDAWMPDNSQELIRLAFEAAKRSGRPNWYRMDVGVLKNRILNVTNGGFRESDYGCTAFMEFVRSHSDILELDETGWPPSVTLKGVHEEPELASDPVRKQVRPDLWRAVMDFSGDRRYVWDDDEGVAKPAGDVAAGGAGHADNHGGAIHEVEESIRRQR